MPFHIMETKDQTYTMASSLNERQKWLKLHDWALLGTWNLEDLWKLLLNCISCVHKNGIKFIKTYVTNRLKLSKFARGQVIHRLNHTCEGQTWMWNGTPITFSNQLLCHSCIDLESLRTPTSGTIRPIRHVLVTPLLSVFEGAQHRVNGSLPSPGHMGPTTEL